MSDAPALSADFPAASEQDWQALVTKTLKDKPFESLLKTTSEGLPIAPLYVARQTPAEAIATRPFDAARPWDIRTLTAYPDPAAANVEILADLEGGAASVVLKIDPTGHAGVAVGSAADLARALAGVVLEMAPVALDAGFLGPKAADWLAAAAKSSPGAKLRLNLDPLSAFAETGASPGPIEAHVISAATVATRLADTYPQGQLFLASGRVVHEAGGGEALEVAVMAAATVAYAKALVRAGLGVPEAFARISLGLSVDGDYFLSMAKLRAARRVFARIAEASGADPQARIEARSSRRMLTVQDAWTNMIRLTAAGVAGAAGGADALVLGCFTDAIGLPTAFTRRQSRNTQLVLMEEAHVGKVADPGAGAGYVEALTDEIARAAWTVFQSIEAAGGLAAALASGDIARRVAETAAGRPAPKIVGVTAFPPESEAPIDVLRPPIHAAQAPDVKLPGPDGACPALTPIRQSQPYEAAQ